MIKIRIQILGTGYDVLQKTANDDILLDTRAGYCDNTRKEIVVSELKPEPGSNVDAAPAQKRLLRHEIIHAFLFESGLDVNSDWGADETLVDWIALQFPKMEKAFREAGCM